MENQTIAEKAMVSFYATQKINTGVDITLQEYLDGVALGRWKKETEYIRAVAHDKKQKDERKKEGLAGVTIPGTFNLRRKENLREYSRIMGLDFDGLGSELPEFLAQAKADPYTYAVFLSVSGTGVCILVRVEPERWLEAFESLEAYYLNKYQRVVDTGTKDITRLRFISYDPDLFVNEKALLWKQYLKKKAKSAPVSVPYVHTGRDIEFVIGQIERDRIDLTSSYDQWYKIGFALISEYGENGRNMFHRISQFHPDYEPQECDRVFNYLFRYGSKQITIGTFYYYAKLANVQIFSPRTKEVVRVASMYKRQASTPESAISHLAEMEHIPAEESKPIVDAVFASKEKFQTEETFVDEIELYLKQSHPLHWNELNRQFETPEGRSLQDKDFYAIYFDTKKALGEKVTFNEVNMLIHSQVTAQSYHPLKEFFRLNKHRNETGLIRKWAESINTDTGLEAGDFSPEYAYRFLRRWLIGLVSNVYGDPCPLVPILTGKKGTGKTEFFRRLLPSELRSYFAPSTWMETKDEQLLMCNNLITFNDEFKTKGKIDIEYFRSLASADYFTIREVYARKPIRVKRIAAMCGTSNQKDIIVEAEHNRRIIPINVLSIDFAAYNDIDKADLLMEAYHAYKAGEKHELDMEERRMLDELTTGFHRRTIERQAIDEFVSIPSGAGGEAVSFSSAYTIQMQLETKSNGRKLSEYIVGRELQAAGFERKRRRVGGKLTWGYEVVFD